MKTEKIISQQTARSLSIVQYTPQHESLPCLDHLRNRLPLNDRLLPVVPGDAVVVIAVVLTVHLLKELLVMGDDDQLEVGL